MSAPITQADREASADILDEVASLIDNDGIGQVADLIRDCEYDDHDAVRRLAAHRIAAERETVEQIVEWLRESAAWHEKHDDGLSGFGHISLGQTEAADAIEEGDWRND